MVTPSSSPYIWGEELEMRYMGAHYTTGFAIELLWRGVSAWLACATCITASLIL
jgi:hypothetical protein